MKKALFVVFVLLAVLVLGCASEKSSSLEKEMADTLDQLKRELDKAQTELNTTTDALEKTSGTFDNFLRGLRQYYMAVDTLENARTEINTAATFSESWDDSSAMNYASLAKQDAYEAKKLFKQAILYFSKAYNISEGTKYEPVMQQYIDLASCQITASEDLYNAADLLYTSSSYYLSNDTENGNYYLEKYNDAINKYNNDFEVCYTVYGELTSLLADI